MPPETETQNSPTPPIETPSEPSLIGSPLEDTTTETTPPVEKTPEQVAEEAAAAEAEAARLAPLTVEDLVLPEGFVASDELRAEFVETINSLSDLGPKERAEALLSLQAKAMTAASEASSAAWDDMQEQWRTEAKTALADNLQPTLTSINRLVTEFGSKELNDVFALTGAGNSIHMIKFLGAVAEKLTEGSFTTGSPAGAEQTAAQRMYPSMSK